MYAWSHILSSTISRQARHREILLRVDAEGSEERRRLNQLRIVRRVYDFQGPHHFIW